jgi:hypothetical protein
VLRVTQGVGESPARDSNVSATLGGALTKVMPTVLE